MPNKNEEEPAVDPNRAREALLGFLDLLAEAVAERLRPPPSEPALRETVDHQAAPGDIGPECDVRCTEEGDATANRHDQPK